MKFLSTLAICTLSLLTTTSTFASYRDGLRDTLREIRDNIALREGEVAAQQRFIIPLAQLKVNKPYTITCTIEDPRANTWIQIFALESKAGSISINDQPAGYEFAQILLATKKNQLIFDEVTTKKEKANMFIANLSADTNSVLKISNCRAVSR